MKIHLHITENFWKPAIGARDGSGRQVYTCTLCNSGKTHRKAYKAEHEKGFGHKQLLELHRFKTTHPDQDSGPLEQEHETQRAVIQDSLMDLLRAMGNIPVANGSDATRSEQEDAPTGHSSVLDWRLGEDAEATHFAPSYEQEVAQNVARQLYAYLDSDDEAEERDPEDVEEAAPPPEVTVARECPSVHSPILNLFTLLSAVDELPGQSSRKRMAPQMDDNELRRHWFPWRDKIVRFDIIHVHVRI